MSSRAKTVGHLFDCRKRRLFLIRSRFFGHIFTENGVFRQNPDDHKVGISGVRGWPSIWERLLPDCCARHYSYGRIFIRLLQSPLLTEIIADLSFYFDLSTIALCVSFCIQRNMHKMLRLVVILCFAVIGIVLIRGTMGGVGK